MPFTVEEFHDLVRLLEQYPEWQRELRRLILTEEILTLPQLVRELAEAQRRTEQRVEELAQAQRRTEQRVEELAQAQRRTEQRVEELAEAQRRTEQRVEELAEAQRRTEQRVEELAEAQRRTEERMDRLEQAVEALAEAQRRTELQLGNLQREVGNLQRVIGATVEESAEGVAIYLARQKGYTLEAEPYELRLDGNVDVVLPVVDAAGQRVWFLVEVTVRQGYREVQAWSNRIRSEGFRRQLASVGIAGPYLAYAFGLRVDQGAIEAARRGGIGLLTPDGERIEPAGLIPPAGAESEPSLEV